MTREQIDGQRQLLGAVREENPGGFISLPFAMALTLLEMAEKYLDYEHVINEWKARGGYAAKEQE